MRRIWILNALEQALDRFDDWFLSRDIAPIASEIAGRPITTKRVGQHLPFLREKKLVVADRVWRNHDDPRIRCNYMMLKYRRNYQIVSNYP